MSKKSDIAVICACCCALPFFIALTCVLLAIPIYLLIVGIVKMDSCPIDSRIPVWMICTSALMFIERMMETMNQAMEQRFLKSDPKPSQREGKQIMNDWEQRRKDYKSNVLFGFISLSRLAIFVSTIVGSVFVFSSFSNRSQCDGLLYWSAFVYCIISLSISALGLIVVGGMFFVLTVLATRSNRIGQK